MDLGVFYIDPAVISTFLDTHSTTEIIFILVSFFAWIFLSQVLIEGGLFLLAEYKQKQHIANWKYVVLAIDIPLLNVQTPKAVEQLFAHLAGAHEHVNIAEKFRHGHKQRSFSFEIISVGGYIQFLVWVEEELRDLVEAALYAQYPDAEVTEVEDYVDTVPSKFPNETHDMWGADFELAENQAYPIRTYEEFEHSISKDTVLKDPMGTFLESFTRIGKNEQMWVQIIVEPVDSHWKEESIEKVNELIGTEAHHGGDHIVDKFIAFLMKFIEVFGDNIFGREPSEAVHEEHDGPPNQLSYLTPGQKTVVEAMEKKMNKLGFKTKIRGIYVAPKADFHPNKGVAALVGAMNQYNIPTANSIVPKFGSSAHYINASKNTGKRKTKIMEAYKKRKLKLQESKPYILNIEELATIWHFPMSHVKTPLVQKSIGKQAEPPIGLPLGLGDLPGAEEGGVDTKKTNGEKKFHTDSGGGDYPSGMKFG